MQLTGIWPLLLILLVLFGTFYFFMVRPLRQREKKHDEMVETLQIGDQVITAGGIYGEVASIDATTVVIKLESGATMRVIKGGVASRREDQ
ncbi:MAG: preprotein translocase subunit YajC [Chloroflexota bacterium]